MADAVNSPGKTAEVSPSPARGSVAEASTPDTDSVHGESKPQPAEIKPKSSRLRRFVPVLLVLLVAAVLLVVTLVGCVDATTLYVVDAGDADADALGALDGGPE